MAGKNIKEEGVIVDREKEARITPELIMNRVMLYFEQANLKIDGETTTHQGLFRINTQTIMLRDKNEPGITKTTSTAFSNSRRTAIYEVNRGEDGNIVSESYVLLGKDPIRVNQLSEMQADSVELRLKKQQGSSSVTVKGIVEKDFVPLEEISFTRHMAISGALNL